MTPAGAFDQREGHGVAGRSDHPRARLHSNWRELIKPKRLEVDEKSLTPTYGKFVGEPFERGFGTTIGNALRRVLLSSLQGAAISAVRVERRAARVLDDPGRDARTSPTSCST